MKHDIIDMKYNLLLEDKDIENMPSHNHQVFWNNFVKMMNDQKINITLVWDMRNKTFNKTLSSAIMESPRK